VRQRRLAAPALTISDIRRARRATGLSLDDLSTASGVPAARLRELEWGYLRNWRADEAGRAQVVQYARASGLDENVVLSIAWPMIEDASTIEGALTIVDSEEPAATALVPSGPQALTIGVPVERRHTRTALASWAMAVVGAALIALATFAITEQPAQGGAAVRAEASNAPAVSPAGLAPAQTAPESRDPEGPRSLRPISSRAPAAPPARRTTAPHKRRAADSRSFLGRELFRIVIR
jgi:hypothetical protein